MSLPSVRIALETALNAMTPALATAWQNSPFTPVTGTPYQKVFILTAEPGNAEYGPHYQERGIFQVTLMYPLMTGSAAAEARGELLRTVFARGNSFISGGVTVTIERTPHIGQGMVDSDRWAAPIKIRYFANIST